MKKVELLAPAGSIESLYGAVNSGADAVYMGGSKFSARAYATNFHDEKMEEAVRYCHVYGVKVHVTINTLLKDCELNEALSYARFLYNIGVDALIIQDAGFAALLRQELPGFEIHASTQMTIHNAEGAMFLKQLGFKRVVLSRELSLKEIKNVTETINMETEIFIHGALCICYSGQCLMSSLIGGRSGNRGRCAQPCRLPYTLKDGISGAEKKAYALSPKDICTLDSLREIVNTGVASLKIEGRMKRPEYVAGVVGTYRKALDFLYENKELDIKDAEQRVLQLFNREGASRAYLFGNWGADMMAFSNPKNAGMKLGTADDSLNVKLLRDLSVQDGISAGESGFEVSKIIMDTKETDYAHKGETVKIYPTRYKKGDILYKTSDSILLEELGQSFKNPFNRKLEILADVDFRCEKKVKVNVNYKKYNFEVQGEMVQKPLKRPLEQAKFIENLTKTQNTPFIFKVNILSFEEGFIPVSSVNEIRRNIIDKIYDLESKVERKAEKSSEIDLKAKAVQPDALVVVSTEEQLQAALASGMKDIALDIFNKGSKLKINPGANYNQFLKIPNIVKEEYEEVCSLIDENINSIAGLVTGNLGIINKYYGKLGILGDYKLNIFNKHALEFYNNFNSLCCISVELNRGEIRNMLKHGNSQILVYGKIELMVSEYCMAGSLFGGKTRTNACSAPCNGGNFLLQDRKGFEFRVLFDKYCRTRIYNNAALNLISNLEELKSFGATHFRLDFTDEDYNETKKVLESFIKGRLEYGFDKYTRGHYKRGVE